MPLPPVTRMRAVFSMPGGALPTAARPVNAACRAHRTGRRASSPVLDEGAVAQLAHRLLQLGLRVHHDRAVPGDRLLDRLARDQEKAGALLAGLDRHLVAAVEQHERAVAGALAHETLAPTVVLLGEHAERLRGARKRAGALEHVCEGVPRGFHRQALAAPGRHEDVEVARLGRGAVDRPTLAPELAADHPHAGAVVVDDLGNLL